VTGPAPKAPIGTARPERAQRSLPGKAANAEGANPVTRIEATLADLLRLTGSIRVHEARAKAAGLRVSRTQLGFLGWLAERGPTPVSTLAEWADVSQPAASRALGQLEADGYVERIGDDRDARVNLMVLTPEGVQARARVLDLMRSQLASALSGMSAADCTKLADLMTGLVAGLREARISEQERA
jgi:DNA-binding MarR family transcriptional regulator